MGQIRTHVIVAVAALAYATAPVFAQCVENQKLAPPDQYACQRFGTSVSISADRMVVGATNDSAYVFRSDGDLWLLEQQLSISDSTPRAFGYSVSISEDKVVVGAAQSAYVFRLNGGSWIEEQRLSRAGPDPYQFLWRVAVSGDTIVVGTNAVNCATGTSGVLCGAAYVFRYDGSSWVEEQKLTASDTDSRDLFGSSVAVRGDTIVVGAYQADGATAIVSGAAYVYRFDGSSWVEEQKLTASDAAPGSRFGFSVFLSEDTAIIGAPNAACEAGYYCGAAYIYRFDGSSWFEEQKLIASDAESEDTFGGNVTVGEDTAVVGAIGKRCAAGDRCGAAYVYEYDGSAWVERQRLTASDPFAFGYFGGSVAARGDLTVVGADPYSEIDCGAAYVFACRLFPTILNLDINPGSCPNLVNPRSHGVVRVAIVGTVDVDVATINPDSLTLARVDGVGAGVKPLARQPGGRTDIRDLATPYEDEVCGCHKLHGDGIADLLLRFSTAELSSALELEEVPQGTTLELVLRGILQDGTTFEASDCIQIPGNSRESRRPPQKDKPR